MSDKSSEVKFMSATAEASFLIRQLAEPIPPGDSVKAGLSRAYRRLEGWTFNRVRDVWHADHRIRISAEELAHLRNVAKAKAEDADRDEFSELRTRISILEHRLATIDPDFHSEAIEAISQASSHNGG